jgi:DNA helicase TIP49 (TBP-interacting protein)
MKIEEAATSSLANKSRVSAHSHVKGLGLDASTGQAKHSGGGLVGQIDVCCEFHFIFVTFIICRHEKRQVLSSIW